jgi:hypothetical protein
MKINCDRPVNQFDLYGGADSETKYYVETVPIRLGKVPSEGWGE